MARGSASTRSASVDARSGPGASPAPEPPSSSDTVTHSPTGLPSGSARTANRPKSLGSSVGGASAPSAQLLGGRRRARPSGRAPSNGGTRTAADETDSPPSRDVSGPTPGDAMTRSEEQLRVRTDPAGRAGTAAQAHRHRVQAVTVPVRREEIRLEQEPIGGAGHRAGRRGRLRGRRRDRGPGARAGRRRRA